MFCTGAFPSVSTCLEPGETLVLYTDGVTEAFNEDDDLYGEERLSRVVVADGALDASGLLERCLNDLAAFRGRAPRSDDVTLMVVRRTA
jgi:sigma-B regulation protein RsbU (phosphoserine phosphatase)